MADKKPAMKFSLSLGAKKQAAAPSTLKRPVAALQAFEEEVDAAPTAQIVSAFDAAAGGAIDASTPQTTTGPVVIAPQPNRDWRAESRKKQRSRLPDGAQQGHNAMPAKEPSGAPQIAFGLTVVKAEEGEAASKGNADNTQAAQTMDASPTEKPTEDQIAMQALLGERPESDLVLDMSEDTVFQNDFSKAPPAPSLEDYAKVAIEDFGAAYLRGFGWKGGDSIQQNSKATKPPVRRSALLGLGAKEEAAVGIELGEWGKSSKGKRKVDQAYNPVLLLNKETGEKLTEEELKARIEQQKMVDEEPASARKKRSPAQELEYRTSEKLSRQHKSSNEDERSGSHRRRDDRDRNRDRDRDRDREKRRDRDHDSKHRSSRRERSSSTDSRRKRKRRDYDERDSDSSKRRHKEGRYREDRYDRGASKREDRDRERQEDSGRRRKHEVY